MAKRQRIDLVPTVEAISELLNQPDTWNSSLDEILLGIEWSEIEPNSIVPKQELRLFTKSIYETEIRLAVMKFLHEYARYYFFDSALQMGREKWEGGTAYIEKGSLELAEKYISDFQMELGTQIKQIEKIGEFSGDKFSKLQKRNDELEKQVKELKNKNDELETELDRFRHPYDYGKHIPEPLWSEMFFDIMSYLTSKRIVKMIPMQTAWGEQPCCYYWCGSKVLFCYFVTQLNIALNLKKGRDNYDWQVFEPAIQNYDNLIKEARKAYSVCKNNKAGIKDAKKIDEAIQYALKKETDASAVRIYPTKNTNTNRV